MPQSWSKLAKGDGQLTSTLYKTNLWVKNYERTLKISAHPLPSPYSTHQCKTPALKKFNKTGMK